MGDPYTSGFSKDTYPSFYDAPSMGTAYQTARHVSFGGAKEVHPARDARYPAYAGTMSDGRLVTDYRPQCTKNVRAGTQFHTKHWMIQHAVELMEESRRRQVNGTGASLPMASTAPPPAAIVYSTPFSSEQIPTGFRQGLGTERADAVAPPLFGTFSYDATVGDLQNNRKNTSMTTYQEGGRNSRRGPL